jgi:hypothetical protein
VLRGQCLDRRIGERKRLVAEIAAWEKLLRDNQPEKIRQSR